MVNLVLKVNVNPPKKGDFLLRLDLSVTLLRLPNCRSYG